MSESPPQSQPPKKRQILAAHVVRVTLGDGFADVRSRGGEVRLRVPRGSVAMRFPRGARDGYFRVEVYEDGVVEVGDRVPDPDPGWP